MGGVTDGQTVIKGLKSVFSSTKNGKWKPFGFTLFTSFTPIILFVLAAMIFFQRINNEHINCYVPTDDDIRATAVNQYCFVTGTYTVTEYPERLRHLHRLLPYPGVGPAKPEGTKVKYHLYFQWVPFLLCFQAIIFGAPNFIWKSLKKDTLSRYCKAIMLEDHDNTNDKFQQAAQRFFRNIKHQSSFSTWFVFTQLINVGVAGVAFLLSDMLLDGQFSTLGREWLTYLQTDTPMDSEPGKNSELNPLNRIFPKISKCEFKKFGPSGKIINYDIICVMTLNVLHDKVFLFLWFWLLLLIILQIVSLFYQLIILRIKDLQCKFILKRVELAFLDRKNRDGFEMHYIFKESAKKFLRELGYSDWYLLLAISASTEAKQFTNFFQSLVNEYCAVNSTAQGRSNKGKYYDPYEQEETFIPESGRGLERWQRNGPYSYNENFTNSVNKQNEYHSPPQLMKKRNQNNHSRHPRVETVYTPLNQSLKEMRQQEEHEERDSLIGNPNHDGVQSHNLNMRNDRLINLKPPQQTHARSYNTSHSKNPIHISLVDVPDGSNDHEEQTEISLLQNQHENVHDTNENA